MQRIKCRILFLGLCMLFSQACSAELSEEELEAVRDLNSELEGLRSEISGAEEKDSRLAGGLVKALVGARLEVLKNTEALVQQRIHAIESGAKITVSVPATEPNQELASELAGEVKAQEVKLEEARQEAARYSGGLVAAMKSAAVATAEQTLAMLEQRLLVAKYGLAMMPPAQASDDASPLTATAPTAPSGATDPGASDVANEVITVRLLKKRYTEQDYQDYIFFDIEFSAGGLDKPTRAIKGVLHFQDLFGEKKMSVGWTLDKPMSPEQTTVEKGTGFKYNQFTDSHQWVRNTEIENMTASFTVRNILYQDGTRMEF